MQSDDGQQGKMKLREQYGYDGWVVEWYSVGSGQGD